MKLPISSAAISKASAVEGHGYMDGNDLLNDLRGNNGATMRSVAVGYVMALHDAEDQPALIGHRSARFTLEQAVNRVEDWLDTNPSLRNKPASLLVREALGGVPAREPTKHGPRTIGILRRGWRQVPAWSLTIVLSLATALCGWALNQAVVRLSDRSAPGAELSRRAEGIARLVLEERRYEKDLFINIEDRERIDAYAQKWNEARTGLVTALAGAEELELSEQDRKALGDIAADFRFYARGYEEVLQMIRRGKIRTPQEANDEFARYKAAAHRIEASCAALYERAAGRIAPLT